MKLLFTPLELADTPSLHPRVARRVRSFSGLFLLSVLAACSTTDQTRVTSTAVTPLNDLNLVNAPIPEVLAAAQRGPYALPVEPDCPALASEIKALDEALGPDLDAPPSEAHRGLLERGTEATTGAAVSLAAGEDEMVPAAIALRLLGDEHPVRVWREYRGLSVKDLAEAALISPSYLSQIETGRREGTLETMARIARALRIDLDDLVRQGHDDITDAGNASGPSS